MARPQAPAGFVTIGPGIYITIAPVRAAPLKPDDSAPNVVLIFGWAGALTRYLQNYSQKYTELYPHTTQIIVKCMSSFLLTSARGQENRLLPVVKALEGLGCLPSTNNSTPRVRPRILVHSFSNGGGVQLTYLGRLLSSRYPCIPPSTHLVSALVLDSSPAIGNFRSFSMAVRIAIRNPIVRYVTLALFYVMRAYRLSLQVAFGTEGTEVIGTQYLEALLNPRLLPWMNSETPRLYIFSKKDEITPWQSIQQHAEAAKTSGLNIRCEIYEDSDHVAHMRHDPERYWTSIQDLWQAASQGEYHKRYPDIQHLVGYRCLSKL